MIHTYIYGISGSAKSDAERLWAMYFFIKVRDLIFLSNVAEGNHLISLPHLSVPGPVCGGLRA